jgi:hypothetical protein
MSETMTECGECGKDIPVKGKHRAIRAGQEVRVCYSCYLKLLRGAEGRKREETKKNT